MPKPARPQQPQTTRGALGGIETNRDGQEGKTLHICKHTTNYWIQRPVGTSGAPRLPALLALEEVLEAVEEDADFFGFAQFRHCV